MRVLITNDDGIQAPGLLALERALTESGLEVLVAAPSEERSAASHSVSLRRPITVEKRGTDRLAITGTPVDAVNLAVNHFFKDRPPDLIISGINQGANLACDIHYSGTVGGAREGAMLGIPAMAVSLETFRDDPDFEPSARAAVKLAGLISMNSLPPRTFLNVNLPDLPEDEIKGLKVTVMGKRNYENTVRVEDDGNGGRSYFLGGAAVGGDPIPGSDVVAVSQGYVSITPLRLDLTNDCAIDWLKDRIS